MSGSTGLDALVEAARLALRGSGLREVLEAASRFREAFAATLLHPDTVAEAAVMEAYMERVRLLRGLLADALAASGYGGKVAQALADIVVGLAAVSGDGSCVLLASGDRLGCARVEEAAYLEAAGAAAAVKLFPGLAEG